MKRKSIEEVKKEFLSKGYTPLFDVYNRDSEHLLAITKEGYYIFTSYNCLKANKRSNIYSNKNPYTIANINKYIKNENIPTRLITSKYTDKVKKMVWECPCGRRFERSWNQFYSQKSHYCTTCSKYISSTKRKLSMEDVTKLYKKNDLSVCLNDGEYINYRMKLKAICSNGYIFHVSLDEIIQGYNRRKPFSTKNPYAIENIKKFLLNEDTETKIISSSFNKNTEKITWECGCCGEVFTRSLLSLTQHKAFYCTSCTKKQSGLEIKTEKWLVENRIEYITQAKFDDCKDKEPLAYDFYLPSLGILIECDGEQHYRPVNFNGISNEKAIELHMKTKKRDSIRDNYANTIGFKLIRIPYWEFKNQNYKEILGDRVLGNAHRLDKNNNY